jgi:hypothetical protein
VVSGAESSRRSRSTSRVPEPPYTEGMARRDRTRKAAEKPAVMAAGVGGHPSDERQRAGPQPPEGLAANGLGDTTGSDHATVPRSQDEVEIVRRATEVLGINHVGRWMRSKIPSLGNQTPYALMQTEDGRRQVERVLLKIEHGVY